MTQILSFGKKSPKVKKENLIRGFFDVFRSQDKFTRSIIVVVLLIVASTPFIVANRQIFTPKAQVPPAFINTIDQLIATRPDHANLHAVHLPDLPGYPMWSAYSWGKHGTEDNKTHGSGSVNLWLAMLWDQSNLNRNPNVKINIRRMYGYVLNNGTWTKIYDGLPTWYVSTVDTGCCYTDLVATHEADGSLSFVVPKNLMLHMSTPAPGLRISGSQAVVSVVEARLLGTAVDIASSKLALSAGADYRDAAGNGSSIVQSGFGQGGQLTADWQPYNMISTNLTDAQIRANPPPGFLQVVTASSPTPTLTPKPTAITPTPPPVAIDSDGDGCPDVKELGPDWHRGGQRDPNSRWDFSEMPVPAISATNWNLPVDDPRRPKFDHVISAADAQAVYAYVGTRKGGPPNSRGFSYDTNYGYKMGLTNDPNFTDGMFYDRTPSTDSVQFWRTGPPKGAVTESDASLIFSIFSKGGSNCK
ncbi:MAG: hypothetical protein M1372_02495 [Patescibacteria group bacterium]|nr:hypothetical protein [Patescibacteria group bacterium]